MTARSRAAISASCRSGPGRTSARKWRGLGCSLRGAGDFCSDGVRSRSGSLGTLGFLAIFRLLEQARRSLYAGHVQNITFLQRRLERVNEVVHGLTLWPCRTAPEAIAAQALAPRSNLFLPRRGLD